MGISTPKQKTNWNQTGNGIKKGDAPAPGRPGDSSRGHVHDAGFSYAGFAKSNPPVGGQSGSGQAGHGMAVAATNPHNQVYKKNR